MQLLACESCDFEESEEIENANYQQMNRSDFENVSVRLKNQIVAIAKQHGVPVKNASGKTSLPHAIENMISIGKYDFIRNKLEERNRYFRFDGNFYVKPPPQ